MKEGIEILERNVSDDPFAVIAEIRQEVALLGRNDSEFPRLDEIVAQLRSNTLAPAEAIRQAREVLSGKQEH
jgi:hypothetical protein